MKSKVRHIPTLQEYAKKRRKYRSAFSDINNCSECDYYRSSLKACLWGNSIRSIEQTSCCPITQRALHATEYRDF